MSWRYSSPPLFQTHKKTNKKNEEKEKNHVVISTLKDLSRDFPGGTVVKNLPANAGDTGSSPGPGRYHMLQSN